VVPEHQASSAGDSSLEKEQGAMTKGQASQSSLSTSRQLLSTLHSSMFLRTQRAGLFIGIKAHFFIIVGRASRQAEVMPPASSDMRPFSEAGLAD
jgi:hypothetical protein